MYFKKLGRADIQLSSVYGILYRFLFPIKVESKIERFDATFIHSASFSPPSPTGRGGGGVAVEWLRRWTDAHRLPGFQTGRHITGTFPAVIISLGNHSPWRFSKINNKY